MKAIRIEPHDIRKYWPHVMPLLKKATALSPGKVVVADILSQAEEGGLGVWAVVDARENAILAAFTTRVAIYPRSRALAVDFMGGGRMKEWIGIVDETLSDHARELGCTRLEGFGRDAWGRVLKGHGWGVSHVTYEKELDK